MMSLFAIVFLFVAVGSACGARADASLWFEQYIRPLLAAKCLKCHGANKQESGLRLDSLEAMLQGGNSGPAIVKGKPGESLLIEAVRYQSLEMPPTGQLPQQEIERLEWWIANNAPWPEHQQQIREGAGSITPADRQWWAFQPLRKPEVPKIEGDDWSRNEIDRFVYRKLTDRGMQPAPRADKVTLVRRLYYDLIGLPPSPEQIDTFVNDTSADAWERLIDSLLASEHYGEHWARYWLDLVRYAESDGWNQDAYRPHVWRYRDYVVQSLNEDKPYRQFVLEQLAGDELPGDDPENLAATGFLRLGIYEYNQRDARSHWNDIVNEITDITGDVFLGMGMACARCHDHKFDPLLQEDYFKLRAFFEPLIWRDDLRFATDQRRAEYQAQLAIWKDATRDVRARIDALLKPYYDRKWKTTVDKFPLDIQACFHKPVEERTSWEHQMAYLVDRQFLEEGGGPLMNMTEEDKQRHESLLKELSGYDSLKPQPLPELMAATDFSGAISPTVIPDDPREMPIEPGFLAVLEKSCGPVEPDLPELGDSSGRRTALAQWIGRPDNPLTTRVIVNRIWQQHFGQGIVPTSSDFGHLGRPPSHPELLDWLTVQFVENGWSFKQLHKWILASATWQQSAHHSEAAEYQQKDPEEILLWRARIRRLSAEQIRDAMLSASGELDHTVGGPSVEGDVPRRSLYVKSFRNTPDEMLHAFDAANGLKSVAERNTTTTPTQALLMINGAQPLERARKMAERLVQLQFENRRKMLAYAFRLAWGRRPTQRELNDSLQFASAATEPGESAVANNKRVDFCHVLLNSSPFLYVD